MAGKVLYIQLLCVSPVRTWGPRFKAGTKKPIRDCCLTHPSLNNSMNKPGNWWMIKPQGSRWPLCSQTTSKILPSLFSTVTVCQGQSSDTEVNEQVRTGASINGALLRTLPWQKGRWGDRRRGTAFASNNEALLKVNTGRRVGGWCGEEC